MSASVISPGFALSNPPLAFTGTIAPTRLSLTYRLGLVIVAVTMLMLPLLYVGLIAATGAGVWWHAIGNVWLLRLGSSMQWRALLYATPLVAGIVLMFFMVKPILTRPSARRQPLPIDAADEPVLFSFIDEICRQVGARRPRRVQVDCNVNASAGLIGGRLGLLRRELVLTIGLPLAAGLTVRELGGVMAHEFGHFAQGGGMRLTAVVRGVNAWFARVVYERDAWDETLERWSREADGRLGIVLGVARVAVWVSRWILYLLMLGGHAISCFMLRQMEYDADSYEIKIAGSDAFIRTAARLRELGAGAHLAYSDVRDAWSRGTLPVDLPTLMAERTRRLPADMLARVHDDNGEATGWFDTHPSDADRVRAAEAARAAGILVDGDAPAVRLFRNFEALSAAATRRHFEEDLGLDLARVTLVETNAALIRSQERDGHVEAIQQFFGDRVTPYRPLRLALAGLESFDVRQLVMRMAAARTAMTAAEANASRDYEEFDALEKKQQLTFAATELFAAGFTGVSAEDFGLPEGTAAAAEAANRAAADRQQILAAALDRFEAAAASRLSCGLVLMREHDDALSRDEAGRLVAALNAIADVMVDVRELRRLEFACRNVEGNDNAPFRQASARIDQLRRRGAACRERIRKGLARVAGPQALGVQSTSLAEHCGFPHEGPIAPNTVERVLRLYIDLIGRVAAAALHVESRRI